MTTAASAAHGRYRLRLVEKRVCVECREPLAATDATTRCELCRVRANTRFSSIYFPRRILNRMSIEDVLLEDPVACPAAPLTPFDTLASAELHHMIAHGIAALSTRDQTMLALRFFGGLTLKELGERYGITRERVRQIEYNALRKIREMMPPDVRDSATLGG